jgi:hypothetical protein
MQDHTELVNTVEITADGQRAVSASTDHSPRV